MWISRTCLNLAHISTLYIMSGLLADRYNKDPIIPIYMVIHKRINFICYKFGICSHRSIYRFGNNQVELVQQLFRVLLLSEWITLWWFLDLQPQKKVSSPIMLISHLFPIKPANSSHKYSDVIPKMISSTYSCIMSSSILIRNKVLSIFLRLKPLFNKNFDNLSYQALEDCFNPYKALFKLEHMIW